MNHKAAVRPTSIGRLPTLRPDEALVTASQEGALNKGCLKKMKFIPFFLATVLLITADAVGQLLSSQSL